MDDTFTAIQKEHDPQALLNHLNTVHQRIRFTMETEQQDKLPFLDTLVSRQDNRLITVVYRKPTHTDQYINYNSHHPPSTKRAIITTLTKRAKSVSHPTQLPSELEHIATSFIDTNNYPPDVTHQTIKAALRTNNPPK